LQNCVSERVPENPENWEKNENFEVILKLKTKIKNLEKFLKTKKNFENFLKIGKFLFLPKFLKNLNTFLSKISNLCIISGNYHFKNILAYPGYAILTTLQ